jgi:hypothetical protein
MEAVSKELPYFRKAFQPMLKSAGHSNQPGGQCAFENRELCGGKNGSPREASEVLKELL